ncbi:MAG: histidine--tRNA ligase [Planctomycetes bacterium]|nr:histidine--tRNA ligase [Planctomycetota bacterium]
MSYAPPRGMRDFYPEDMQRRNWLFDRWRGAARAHGFEEYDAPVVETEELLTRKSGEEIVHQIYTFKDKSGRALALRPEMTPSLARMIIARQGTLSFPLKWFSLPQCFRYERTTRGRKREHFQWNLDIVGEEGVIAEAEVLSTALTALTSTGLTADDFHVRLGNRTLLEKLFAAKEIPTDHFLAVCLALDKRGKISDEEMTKLLQNEGLDEKSVEKTFELLAIKTMEEAEKFLRDPSAMEDMKNLFAIMELYGWSEFLTFDLAIIRGLDYYTGIVFEAFDRKGKFRALFGGGRYDNLLSALGGQTVPCVGLGFGDVVVWELLDDLGLGKISQTTLDAYIGYMSEEECPLALQGAAQLRKAGKTVSLAMKPQKPKKFFAAASKTGARFACLIGPGEREKGVLAVKNLETGEQSEASPEALAAIMEK